MSMTKTKAQNLHGSMVHAKIVYCYILLGIA